MEKERRVQINVDKPVLPEKTLPNWNNFWLIPSSCPHLREYVEEVVWDFRNSCLKIDLKETPSFSAFDWFSQLGNTIPRSQDMEQLIALCFFDDNDHELARIEFKGISLESHYCVLNRNEEDEDNGLIHQISLRYVNWKKVKSNNESLQMIHDKFEDTDAEWQTDKEMILVVEEKLMKTTC